MSGIPVAPRLAGSGPGASPEREPSNMRERVDVAKETPWSPTTPC
jgi:hypothetical protein